MNVQLPNRRPPALRANESIGKGKRQNLTAAPRFVKQRNLRASKGWFMCLLQLQLDDWGTN